VGRPAVQPGLLAALELEAECGRNHHLSATRLERFADELFIRERPVRFGGIEEVTPPSTAARRIATPSSRLVAGPLPDRQRFGLDAERWVAFQAALDAPARPNPRLKTLLQKPSVFERRRK
jgi:hypothetical protein